MHLDLNQCRIYFFQNYESSNVKFEYLCFKCIKDTVLYDPLSLVLTLTDTYIIAQAL